MIFKKQPFISIIIPCYNEESYISQAITSLIKNSYSHKKIEISIRNVRCSFPGIFSEESSRD